MKSLFITGTDTGVGKTLVTALLALKLRASGINAGVVKPFATGCESHNGALISGDAVFLRNAVGVEDTLNEINPIRLVEPLAPLVAARRAGEESAYYFARAQRALEVLQARYDTVLVEGVGGLMVPIAQRAEQVLTCRDLIEEWQLPVIIVARRTLGTLNHTLLTAEALRARAAIAGIIFCDAAPVPDDDVAAQTSPAIIAEMTRLPILGQVPFLGDLSPLALQKAAQTYISYTPTHEFAG